MSKKSFKDRAERNADFIRKTITIPAEVVPFAEEKAASPEHAGNLSSYIRTLILADRAKALKAAA